MTEMKYNWYFVNEYLMLLLPEKNANKTDMVEKFMSKPVSKKWKGYTV